MLQELFLLSIVWVTCGKCTIKIWLPNTNYNFSRNWNRNRIPCSTDTVIFPENIEFVIKLPVPKVVAKEFILPKNGEIIMPTDGILVLSGKKFNEACPGEEIVFKDGKVSRWLDYDSWSGSNEATPHVERIPCKYDIAEFPNDRSFAVQLPPVPTVISKFILGKLEMYGELLTQFFNSELGRKEFLREEWDDSPNVVALRDEECQSSTKGCDCGTYQLEDFVCVKQCPVPPCWQPMKPLGFCCHICGNSILGYK